MLASAPPESRLPFQDLALPFDGGAGHTAGDEIRIFPIISGGWQQPDLLAESG